MSLRARGRHDSSSEDDEEEGDGEKEDDDSVSDSCFDWLPDEVFLVRLRERKSE